MSVRSRSNWNLKVLVFKERGKPEYPEKNLSEQGREPTTNSTHIWRRRQDSNPGHIGGRRALSPLRHPCSPEKLERLTQFVGVRPPEQEVAGTTPSFDLKSLFGLLSLPRTSVALKTFTNRKTEHCMMERRRGSGGGKVSAPSASGSLIRWWLQLYLELPT